MSESDGLSAREMAELQAYMGVGASAPEGKHNAHSFLHAVATSDDTTKTGFLSEDEVGKPKYSLRTYKDMANFSSLVMNNPFLDKYYKAKAENLTSTSLSKEAKLITLAVVQKREIADVTRRRKENKGWFRKKDSQEGEEQS